MSEEICAKLLTVPRNFMMLKVRKELYINFTLIKMLPKQKNTPHISHGAVYFKERCMMKRYV